MAAPSSGNGSVARLTTTPTPVSRGRSKGQLSITDLRNLVKAGRIRTVLLAVPDLQGRLKGKWYDSQHFLKHIAHGGAEFCAYVLATDVDMSPVSGFPLASWETGYQDLAVTPALSTLRTLPWLEGTALVLGDAVSHDGAPITVAPRQILQGQMTRLARHGLHVKAGLETEFILYQGTYAEAAESGYQGLRPLSAENLDYALDHPPAADRFFRRLQRALAGAGLPVEAIKTEGAPGQVEVTFPYGGALTACDGHLLFKHAVRALGARAGLAPTFMAAPETGVCNGLHLHVSLWKNGISQFNEPGSGGLSQLARQAIAGLVDALPQLAPLYAPNVNSYKRLVPRSFAPTTLNWGYDNRTCAVRVVGHGEGLHLEIRVPGAFSDHISVRFVVDLRGDVAWMSGTVGWPLSPVGSLPKAGPLSPGLLQFEDLGFEVGDALVGEPVVGASALESFLEPTVFLGELMDASLECGVLGDDGLDGFAGDHLLSVADLPHQLTDLLSLGVYFLLRAGQFCFGVQRPFSPGGFDPVVCLFGGAVVTALAGDDGFLDQAAGVGVVIEERGRHVRPVSDGPDGEAAAFATQLSDGLLDLAELGVCLSTAGSNGCLCLAGARGHGRSS
ncbi:glutamine synthetase family protein [Streptomyces mirabilis]|uniref:glutamine synthetase family protein n=1 Tax=Streptomyces mirabilis TaxID=68239 RepID=UPI0036A9CF2C